MKAFSIIIFLVLAFSSCRNRNQELFIAEAEIRVEDPSLFDNILTYGIPVKDIVNIFEATAAQNGFSMDDIATINPASARLVNVFGDDTYSNISRIRVFMSNKDQTIRREVYYQEMINFNHSGPLNLFGSLSDVKDILLEDTYTLEVELNFRSFSNGFLSNRLEYSFVAYGNE